MEKCLRHDIDEELKRAMKDKKKERVDTLRLIKSAIKDHDIATRSQDTENPSNVNDDDVIKSILVKMRKQRQDSIALYEQGSRPDLVEKEQAEIKIIEEFLPKQMDDNELREVIGNLIKQNQATGPKDMGAIMQLLKKQYMGTVDMAKAGKILKDSLSS